jgi:endonuclease YncB( thermonuclease family)
MRAFCVLLSLLAFASMSQAQVRVVDGDTLELNSVIYRIEGIDAPEFAQRCESSTGTTWPCGESATDALINLVANANVECSGRNMDDYGRIIATCYANGIDVGAALVQSGLAWAFVRFSDTYTSQETYARSQQLGIWQVPNTPPWEFRAQKWSAAANEAPDGCPIKGNISDNGRIYHAPWSPWYDRTRINVAKGERWFCSEADAIDAGWRAPHWR